MKLRVNFTELKRSVVQMGADSLEIPAIKTIWVQPKPIESKLDRKEGIDIDLDSLVTSHGLLSVEGRQVVLFISDHGRYIERALDDPTNGRKFHVADCITLDEMRKRNRFARYKVTANMSGSFPIFGQAQDTRETLTGEVELNVCTNCMKLLNYKKAATGTQRARKEIVASFSMAEFFATFSSVFKEMPPAIPETTADGYSADWKEVSEQTRNSAGWECQGCNVNLTHHHNLLHTHHKNGVKSDNSEQNLAPLCVDCHRKEPFHGKMYVKREDELLINKLRAEQRLLKIRNWSDVIKFADPAILGIVDYSEVRGEELPQVNYALSDSSGESFTLELAWPREKIGIYLGAGSIKKQDWDIYGLKDGLVYLEPER